MFEKNKCTIEPPANDEKLLIQFSKPVEITKKTRITVPANYRAIAFVDAKPLFRIEPCQEKQFVKAYKKEYCGKHISIAYISSRNFARTPWGFGNIQVNNAGLKEAYRVGAHGEFSVDIVDYTKLIAAFPGYSEITVDMLREKCISTLKMVGTPIMSSYFSNTEISVFDMGMLSVDFKEKYISALSEEKIFSDLGIKITHLTVDGFHANEDDLKIIRERLNK